MALSALILLLLSWSLVHLCIVKFTTHTLLWLRKKLAMRREKGVSVEPGETDGPPCFFFSGLRRNLMSCGCVTVSETLSESLLRSTSRGGRCISGCTTSARSDWGCSPRTFPPLTPTSQKVAETLRRLTEFCFILITNHYVSQVLVLFSQSAVFVLAGRQVKMAFVNSVAKPPRDVRRRQEKFGTTSASSAASTAAAAPIKSVLCCLNTEYRQQYHLCLKDTVVRKHVYNYDNVK